MKVRLTIECVNVPQIEGAEGAAGIERDFGSRYWWERVRCVWTGSTLVLSAESDAKSKAELKRLSSLLSDEFSDLIAANTRQGFDGGIFLKTVEYLS